MQIPHYIEIALEALGAAGLLCSALSRLPLGRASAVFAQLGTNFLAAAREMKGQTAPTEAAKHITIPPKGQP